jgi:oxalate decarboxylase/phosphoglucose isomerase-like protein (cupin superfamily)
MVDGSEIPLLDHQLADDELAWVSAIYQDFSTARAAFAGREAEFNPKEALRKILGKPEHRLPEPIDISGDGIWRGGRNRHGRFAACVFLKTVELHRHPYSRTDQFAMYVNGVADAYAEDANGQPILTPVNGGDHFHNPPGAPHAFLPKAGQPVPDDWEIAFIAITPRNLREDTRAVSSATKAAYLLVSGREAPAHV